MSTPAVLPFENDCDEMFDNMFESLQIEHAIQETDFKHIFNTDKINKELNSSPYMEVKDENDKIMAGEDAFLLPDGCPQGKVEQSTLECQLIPGTNKRLGMPKTATKKESVRESEQDTIV